MKAVVIGPGRGLDKLTEAVVAACNAMCVTADAISTFGEEVAAACKKHDDNYMLKQDKYEQTYRDIEFTGKHRRGNRR